MNGSSASPRSINGSDGDILTRQPLGQMLRETAGLQPEQLAEALERQRLLAEKRRYYLLGRVLIGLGYVSLEQVNDALAAQRQAAPAPSLAPGTAPSGSPLDSGGGTLWEALTQSGPVRPVSVLRCLDHINDKVASGQLESMQSIALGFDPTDEALGGGVRPGELILLGGGQGVGKTTMAFQMARNIAATEEAHCLYVCYEHDEENLSRRLISMESVDPYGQDFRLGVTVRELEHQIVSARSRHRAGLFDLLRLDQRTNVSLERLRHYGDRLFLLKGSGRTTLSAIKALVEAHRVRSDERLVLFVDYLQKVPMAPEPATEQELVTRVAQGLKELALSQQIPVVAVVAADREGLKAKRMHAHHFAGSAALAYEADVILVLSEKYDSVARVHIEFNPQKAQAFRDWIVCSVEKNRSGRDVIDMEFEKRFSYCCLNPNGNLVSEKLIDERLYNE